MSAEGIWPCTHRGHSPRAVEDCCHHGKQEEEEPLYQTEPFDLLLTEYQQQRTTNLQVCVAATRVAVPIRHLPLLP